MKSPSRLLYAQVREDPEADVAALGIGPADRVLAVTSGGCTALRLLAEGPRELVCVDFNPAQNYLLELKLAAIRTLPLEECRRFLGARRGAGRVEMYRQVSALLSPEARAFWDRRTAQIEAGVLYAGATESMARWMRRLTFGWIHPPRMLRRLLRQPDLRAQASFYRETWSNRRWQSSLRLAFHPLLFRWVYGRGFLRRLGSQDMSRLWIEKIERGFTDIPARSNYFLSQLFWGKFPPGEEGMPPYLREPAYARIRANSERLRWVTADLQQFLSEANGGGFTKMTLSNAFEWLPPEQVKPAFSSVAAQLSPGGRVVLRHLIGITDLPPGIGLMELDELSGRLTAGERAFLYSRVSVYERS